MEEILNVYYSDNARKLHTMCNKILRSLGFSRFVDPSDFYSLANEVFVDVLQRYEEDQPFDGFLYTCLSNKFKTEMTRRKRKKRGGGITVVSLDEPIDDDCESTLKDLIASNINIEEEILGDTTDIPDERVERYLSSLSKLQRKIIEMKMDSATVDKIKEDLGITDKEYAVNLKQAKQYEHIRLLHI